MECGTEKQGMMNDDNVTLVTPVSFGAFYAKLIKHANRVVSDIESQGRDSTESVIAVVVSRVTKKPNLINYFLDY